MNLTDDLKINKQKRHDALDSIIAGPACQKFTKISQNTQQTNVNLSTRIFQCMDTRSPTLLDVLP